MQIKKKKKSFTHWYQIRQLCKIRVFTPRSRLQNVKGNDTTTLLTRILHGQNPDETVINIPALSVTHFRQSLDMDCFVFQNTRMLLREARDK
ncbi:hypothetical protein CEXT_339491 [Caerostris extrusa]|uniref:Uncharacterized protein n=1 Tax=Caerostris extrusa TaxID=172846 RepID=A0AAV4Y0S7_CAEEX|nr:hypothetical protein CEXT_339491 [Caerostris extrusa]